MKVEDISQTPMGVQVVTSNTVNMAPTTIEPGHKFWDVCVYMATNHMPPITLARLQHQLVRVDIRGWQTQWSFK